MEIDNLKALATLAEKLETTRAFNMLKPNPRRENSHTAHLYFRGYNDLVLTVMDIIKVCTSALCGMEDNGGGSHYASPYTIAEVLTHALSLLPMEESQILDECYELHLKLKAEKSSQNEQSESPNE